ncbi:LacI family DNA-binding transcriptional regulator [Pelagerythrobacter sp.]|uniref:LacI family DNA-binding transcriptional regulator n=1 Tax=Pelagerythrobacter sp. TaxID=2800702 RepID=UPI0035B4A7B0
MSKRRPTSIDVAERAGVSQSTVSRALAGSEVITEATRARVLRAAEEIGYFVDERAARLRRGSTGTLAVVVICRPGQTAADINPFSYMLLGSVCLAASERGFETLVSFQAGDENFFGHYEERGWADGLVVIGTTTNRAAWDYFRGLEREGRRVVYWGGPFDDLEWVRSDNVAAGRMAVEHLLAQGYRAPCFLGAIDSPQHQFAERYEGYCEGMRAAGLTPSLVVTQDGATREEEGRIAMAGWLERGGQADAVFAACDAMALGALEELARRDVAVPREIGLIGFDDLPAARFAQPSLTTIAPDPAAAGSLLVDALFANGDDAPRRVPVSLTARGSTARS